MFHRQIWVFQLSLQESNKAISNNLITLSIIMNEEMPDKNQGRTAREYYVNPFIWLSGFQFIIIETNVNVHQFLIGITP